MHGDAILLREILPDRLLMLHGFFPFFVLRYYPAIELAVEARVERATDALTVRSSAN